MIKSNHIIVINIIGLISVLYFLYKGIDPILWFYVFFTYFLFSCLGITITFHRFLTHKSFKFKYVFLEKLFILLGSLAGTGSALGWVAIHRHHHKHSDSKNDVHGPVRGWKNYVADYDDKVNYILVKDLISNKYILTLHNYGLLVLLIYYVFLLLLGGFNAVALFGFIPQTLTNIISALCNWFSHKTGYVTYNTGDNSKNTWWLSIITWGDSWHNNHHAKPWLYSFSHKWWEIDISGIIIKSIMK